MATAYNYTEQRWTQGAEAAKLRRQQLTESLELLEGEQGQAYAQFIGCDRQTTIQACKAELATLDAIE